jgi:ankyrin repeat domain-containing protein 50
MSTPRHFRGGGVNALICASCKGHDAVFRELWKHDGPDVNATEENGDTLMIIANLWGDDAAFHESKKCNSIIKGRGGATALMIASEYGHDAVVRELLKHDMVDVNDKDKKGETTLIRASYSGHVGVVRELLKDDMWT